MSTKVSKRWQINSMFNMYHCLFIFLSFQKKKKGVGGDIIFVV
jgi:hypothetical protein